MNSAPDEPGVVIFAPLPAGTYRIPVKGEGSTLESGATGPTPVHDVLEVYSGRT